MSTGIVCALSGLVPLEAELVGGDDDHSDIPIGWIRVVLTRREPNPKGEAIIAMKAALVEQALTQIPAKQRADAQFAVELQIEAQFAALEANTPPFLIYEELAYIAPAIRDVQIAAEIVKLRATLGLPDDMTGGAG